MELKQRSTTYLFYFTLVLNAPNQTSDEKRPSNYNMKCPKKQRTKDYTGETQRHLIEHVKDHRGKDTKSHLFKGYLCYKKITSQNVTSEAQLKSFFIF